MAGRCDQAILNIAKKYLEVLRQNGVLFETAWLFGSHVEGRSHPDSDIDIALVIQNIPSRFFKEVELVKYRREIDWRIEPHVFSTDQPSSVFFQDIMKNAVQLA